MIVIVDYGMGNLKSVEKAFLKLGFVAKVSQDKNEIEQAEALVVPGVGSFPAGMKNLKNLGFDKLIIKHIKEKKLFLGICLGMQILFSESFEGEGAKGLSIFSGKVVRFPSHLKVPHIGWNTISFNVQRSTFNVLDGIPDKSFFYFVHSYYVVPEDREIILTTTEYDGIEFVSAIAKENIIACQFHPEKSQNFGLKFLSNFGEMVNACKKNNSLS
jgi:glutamine amidotransferase